MEATRNEKKPATQQLDINDVLSVYSGRHGCCCGCKGKHTYREATQRLGRERRGYPVDDDEVNDSVVRRHLNTINAAIARGEAFESTWAGNGHVYFETETRTFIAYLTAAATAVRS